MVASFPDISTMSGIPREDPDIQIPILQNRLHQFSPCVDPKDHAEHPDVSAITVDHCCVLRGAMGPHRCVLLFLFLCSGRSVEKHHPANQSAQLLDETLSVCILFQLQEPFGPLDLGASFSDIGGVDRHCMLTDATGPLRCTFFSYLDGHGSPSPNTWLDHF